MAPRRVKKKSATTVAVGVNDILFECPNCHKSMVIDKLATNMVVPCVKCNAKVIVPHPPKYNLSDYLAMFRKALRELEEIATAIEKASVGIKYNRVDFSR